MNVACFGFSSFGGLWGGHRPMAPPKGENKAKKASRKAKRVKSTNSTRMNNEMEFVWMKWNKWNGIVNELSLVDWTGLQGANSPAASRKAKSINSFTQFVIELMIVAAEGALFPSCSIKFDWFIDCGPSGWAGQQSIWIQSTFLSFLFSGLWPEALSAEELHSAAITFSSISSSLVDLFNGREESQWNGVKEES